MQSSRQVEKLRDQRVEEDRRAGAASTLQAVLRGRRTRSTARSPSVASAHLAD